MKLMAQNLDFTMNSRDLSGRRSWVGDHGNNRFSSAVTAAFPSPGHMTLRITKRKLRTQVILQTLYKPSTVINQYQSCRVADFSDHIKDPDQEKRDFLSAQPMKDAIATLTQKDA